MAPETPTTGRLVLRLLKGGFADPVPGRTSPPRGKLTRGELERAIRLAITQEQEAIATYKAQAEATADASAKQAFLDNARDEEVHLGVLQAQLDRLCPDGAKAAEEGRKESPKVRLSKSAVAGERRPMLVLRKSQSNGGMEHAREQRKPDHDGDESKLGMKVKPHYSSKEMHDLGLRFVTVHPKGQEPGNIVIVKDLGDEYVVVGGAKGKMNFTRFSKDRTQAGEFGPVKGKKDKPQKPTREATPEDQQKLEAAQAERKQTKHDLSASIMDRLAKEGHTDVTPEEKQRIQDAAIKKAAQLGLGSDETQAFAEDYLKRHGQEKKTRARETAQKAITDALDAQAHEALTGETGGEVGIDIEPTASEAELGALDAEQPKKRLVLSAEEAGSIASLAAQAAAAADTARTLEKELASGDERTIRNVELAYRPLSEAEVKQYAIDRYVGKVELERNAALVEATANPKQKMARDIANGAADAGAGIAAEIAGTSILDARTAKELGTVAASRVVAEYMAGKLGDRKKAAEAMRDYIGKTSSATAAAAVVQSQKLTEEGKRITEFGKGEDSLMSGIQAHAKALQYHNEAQTILGRAAGTVESAAQIALALENPGEAFLAVPGRGSKVATAQKARDLGLSSTDYHVVSGEDGLNIRVKPEAIKKLYREQNLDEYKADAAVEAIRDEAYTPDGFAGYTPQGQSDGVLLTPYQKGNIQMWERQKRVLIADEAGTGKTATMLNGIANLAEQGKVKKALVVVPKSVALQFGDEIDRFLDPKYKDQYSIASGASPAKRQAAYSGDKLITVITHDQLRNDAAAIKAAGFDCVAIDEAHYFSTRGKGQEQADEGSQRSQAARDLNPEYLMLATGTPIKNDMSELHSLMDWVAPGSLGDRKEFLSRFGSLASQKGAFDESLMKGLRDRLAGHMMGMQLTVNHDDGTVELKPSSPKEQAVTMREDTSAVALTPRQRTAYKAAEAKYLDDKKAGKKVNGFTRDENLNKVVNNVETTDHPKVMALKEKLAKHPGEKAVVFATNRYSWDTIIKGLGLKPGEYQLLNGDSTDAQRQQYAREINDPASPVKYLIASDAANFGINLQGASVVANWDPSDTYANHKQRFSRALRKGQKKNVAVYNLWSDTPLEIAAERRIRSKQRTAEIPQQVFKQDESGLGMILHSYFGGGAQ